jgi:NAD(P)-dependent dehydrogenase (short-subunit alcohol dehydrogenase family)
MHMDESVARLTPAGACVVHGVHIVLWALDCLAVRGYDLTPLRVLQVKFDKFALIDQDVSLVLAHGQDGSMKIEILSGGLTVARITLKFGPCPSIEGPPSRQGAALSTLPNVPLEPTVEEMRGLDAWIDPVAPLTAFEAMFPNACRSLGARRVRAVALLSYLVGMVCPGLHSIFSEFTAEIVEIDGTRGGIRVWTNWAEPRFRIVSMGFAGSGLKGAVSALHRFPPIEASLTDIAEMVEPGEFAGRRILVIGGSRGLGAVTAKLTVAGGGEAVITYVRGARQAERVCEDLTSRYGADRCSALHFEVGVTQETALLEGQKPYTHVYYFATPQISRPAAVVFDSSDFELFNRIYVIGFSRLLTTLVSRLDRFSVLYPSSIFVEKRPRHMTAYAMAKAAGEILCQDLARDLPRVTISAPRLPRILTDQTATTPPVEAADAAEIMLPLLRAEAAVN